MTRHLAIAGLAVMMAASCGTGARSAGVGASRPPLSHSFDGSRMLEAAPTTSSTAHAIPPRASRSLVVPRAARPQPAAPAPPSYAEIDGMPVTLRRIGGCESGGGPTAPINWTAKNRRSSASGGFQILTSTWYDPTRGTGWAVTYGADVNATAYERAMDAPPAVQLTVARRAFERQGAAPWNASRGCWG